MSTWATLIIVILIALDFGLWFWFLEYWIANSTNLVDKKIIFLLKFIAFLINSLLIALPILIFKSNISVAYFSLPMLILPFVIGHIWFIFAKKSFIKREES